MRTTPSVFPLGCYNQWSINMYDSHLCITICTICINVYCSEKVHNNMFVKFEILLHLMISLPLYLVIRLTIVNSKETCNNDFWFERSIEKERQTMKKAKTMCFHIIPNKTTPTCKWRHWIWVQEAFISIFILIHQ